MAFSNSGTVDVQTGALSSLGGYNQTDGSTILAGGTLGASYVNLNGGALSGSGSVVATVQNTAGRIDPGAAGTAGVIAITGNYTQSASGVLNIDIGGTGSGQFDRLTVSGTATLGGIISASLFNNFTPATGATFRDVMDFASKSGDFTTQSGFSLGNYLFLQEQFDPSTNPVRLNLVVNQVNQAPTITTNPTEETVTAGQTASFTAAASGNPTPTVQWQVSTDGGSTFSNIAGATSTTLTVSNTAAAQNGDEYQAVFSNSVGTATTSPATLTVDYAPTVMTNPTSLTVNAGQTATFTAAASDGNPTPTTVQWQVSTDGGNTFTPITGATSTTLSLTNTTAAQNGVRVHTLVDNCKMA